MYVNGSLGSIAILDVSIQDSSDPVTSPLNDVALLEAMCKDVVKGSGLTIMNYQTHQFEPYGVTMLFLLAESHLSIHTWPENNCLSMDVHSCACELDTDKIKAAIARFLPVKISHCQFIKRGI